MMKSFAFMNKHADLGVLALRLAFGFRLIYGTIDNILSYEQTVHFSEFLAANGFPLPLVSAYVSVIFQFLAGVSFIAGVWIRFFSLAMILNFTIAIIMVHIGDAYLNTAPAIHLLAVSIFLALNGGGKWTIAHWRKVAG